MPAVAKRKMPRLVLSREVKEFATKRDLAPYLPAIVAVFHRIFADAATVSVEVDYDPEIASLHHLLLLSLSRPSKQ